MLISSRVWATIIFFGWRHVLNKFLGDAMKVFFGGGRIPLDQRACLVEPHAEGIVLLGSKLLLPFAHAGFTLLKSVPVETSHGVPRLIACTHSHDSASCRACRH